MTMELVGYIRKSQDAGALKLNISVDAFKEAPRYTSKTGEEYVALVVNLERLREVIDDDGERMVTSICAIGE